MNRNPIIAMSCRHDTSGTYTDRPINAQNIAYIQAVIESGGTPFLIPLELKGDNLRQVYDLADGILLSGGGDIDPTQYADSPHETLKDVQTERDRVEIALSQWATADNKPILGICRGLQIMAVAAGGTLYQDVCTQRAGTHQHDYYYSVNRSYGRNYLAHTVTLSPQSGLSRLLKTDTLQVNSLHHQAIQTLPKPYQVIGYAPDGIPEAIDIPEHPFCWGVQWHPEELFETEKAAKKIFKAFIRACQKRMD